MVVIDASMTYKTQHSMQVYWKIDIMLTGGTSRLEATAPHQQIPNE